MTTPGVFVHTKPQQTCDYRISEYSDLREFFGDLYPMGVILGPLFYVLGLALSLLKWAVILGVALSWLLNFGIVNVHNQFVNILAEMLFRITEPLLSPIRRLLPSMGGMDFSPLVLVLIIIFFEMMLGQLALRLSLL